MFEKAGIAVTILETKLSKESAMQLRNVYKGALPRVPPPIHCRPHVRGSSRRAHGEFQGCVRVCGGH